MKKHILTLISEGGGGHKSAGESVAEILRSEYDVSIINGIGTVLEPFDWFKRLTRGKISGETIYNWFLQTERGALLRAYIYKGKSHLHARREKIAKLFERFISSYGKPVDLIISTIPFINHGLVIAAKKHNIPFLLLPTDLEVSTFLNGFNDLSREETTNFKLALAYNRPEMLVNVFKSSHLEPEDIVFSGFPVRPACQKFYSPEEIRALKSRLGMEENRHSIILVMGAAGCNGIIEHAKVLSSFDASIQVNICAGRNENSRRKLIQWCLSQGGKILHDNGNLVKLESKTGALLLIRGYTEEIISLLACSDLVISKTGSCTLNEAIYLGKKLLLDHSQQSTARFLPWEEFNVWFIKRHKLGASFGTSEDLRSLVPFILKEERSSSHLVLPDFRTNIRSIVSDMVSGKSCEDSACYAESKAQGNHGNRT